MSVGAPTVHSQNLERGDDMPLFKGSGCKSTPDKVLNYIMDSRKASLISSLNLDDSRSYSEQFRDTALLFDKGNRFDERKYYHFKLSCDQADHVSAAEHHQYAEALASALFPDNECVIATHTDTATIHSHIIVNAVSFTDGRKLDIRNAQYAKMKDIANDLGHQMGFSVLNFRKPAKDRITSAERHIELKGGTSWKQELREVIALAIAETTTIQEFEAYLGGYGVTLTRNTDRTIAYKHPNKDQAIRGDRLGDSYTKGAIIHELTKSRRPDSQREVRSACPTETSRSREYSPESCVGAIERRMREISQGVQQLTSEGRTQQANRERAEIARASATPTATREAAQRDQPDHKRPEINRPKIRTHDFEPDF